jgi:hypothetical protein
VAVLASNTTRRGRDTANRFAEHVWNELRFPAVSEERRSDLPAETAVFPPEFERQRSVDAMEDNLVAQRGPSAFRWNFQLVLANEQLVSLFLAEHLQADQLRRNRDRMETVSPDCVNSLEPGKPLPVCIHKARIVAQLSNSASRLNTPNDVFPRQVLMLNRD